MMGSKSVAVRWLVALSLLVVGGVVWSVEGKAHSGRDLTDGEMARLFGRQPDPPMGGKCQWCAEIQTDNPCTGSRGCPLCTNGDGDMGDCLSQQKFWWFSGNRIGRKVGPGTPNVDWWAIPVVPQPADCNKRYWCADDEPFPNTMCPTGGCGGNEEGNVCWSCMQGLPYDVTPKAIEYCDIEACWDP